MRANLREDSLSEEFTTDLSRFVFDITLCVGDERPQIKKIKIKKSLHAEIVARSCTASECHMHHAVDNI